MTIDTAPEKQRRGIMLVGAAAFRPGQPKPGNPFTTEPLQPWWEMGWEAARDVYVGQQFSRNRPTSADPARPAPPADPPEP